MKKLFSKRSGFTLVEIIIAFAIFAIMASMICQILNLMVRRKVQNKQFEDKLSAQEQTFIAKTKNMEYTAETPDGQLVLQFKDNTDADITVEPIDYQLKNWDDDNPRNSINYFAGDYEYEMDDGGVEHSGDEDPDSEDKDEITIGGSSQMSRFDTRITGTKGINSIKIKAEHTSGTTEYTLIVTVNDSGVDTVINGHQQVTLFFKNENKYLQDGKGAVNIVSVNDGRKDLGSLKIIKPCGNNGVNIHCKTNEDRGSFNEGRGSFGGTPVVFNVELEEEIPLADLGFSQKGEGNIADGITYKPFEYTYKDKDGNDKTEKYVNIFGAYVKASSKPADGDGESTPEE